MLTLKLSCSPKIITRALVGALALTLGGLAANAANPISPFVLAPTPLILKDGRIAEVTVHMLPFDAKSSTLSAPNQAELVQLIQPVATDCFLTAQAIGHVQPGPNADGDTVEAHRLARARADTVQERLTELGLASDSIASVWDWQFLVKESRVTLWIFSMRQGDDCEGKPLNPNNAAIASLNEPAQPAEQPAPTQTETPTPQNVVAEQPPEPEPVETAAVTDEPEVQPEPIQEPVAEQSVEQQPAESEPTVTAETAEPEPRSQDVAAVTAPTELVEEDSPADVEQTTAQEAAPDKQLGEQTQDAAANVAAVTSTNDAVTTNGTSSAADAADLAITFDVNSSWLPSGAAGELQSFLNKLPADGQYQIRVSGAVGVGDVKDASPEDAIKYNRWMAERRVARVSEWLQSNASGRTIEMDESYIDQDSSREVRLTAIRVR